MAVLRTSRLFLGAAVVAVAAGTGTPASAQSTEYVGNILKLPYNFCPVGTYNADGRLLAIANEEVLYTLYGTTYGGDGVSTFGLPDFRSRSSIGPGQGPGLTLRTLGETGGNETSLMTVANMPRHEHTGLVRTTSAAADARGALRNLFGTTPAAKYVSGTTPVSGLMDRDTVIIRSTGEDMPWSHLPPTLTIRYCVVAQGVFPQRN